MVLLFFFNIIFAIWGAINPTKEISPVIQITEETKRVAEINVITFNGFTLTPKDLHSLSDRVSISICRDNNIIKTKLIANGIIIHNSFVNVTLLKVPISQYSIV